MKELQGMLNAAMFVLLIAVCLAMMVVMASAATTLNFVWEYPGTVSDLKGFKMYQTGTVEPIATIGKDARAYTHVTQENGKHCFSLTAFDATSESGHTPEVCVDPPPMVPDGFKVSIAILIGGQP